jgi:dienelactone hydrolase
MHRPASWLLGSLIVLSLVASVPAADSPTQPAAAKPVVDSSPLAGTQPLTMQGDIPSQLVDGVDKFLLQEIEDSIQRRARYWHRDLSSHEAYNASIAPNRARLAKYVGVAEFREAKPHVQVLHDVGTSATLARSPSFQCVAIRWPVFGGVEGEGLLLAPVTPRGAFCIALPDADQTPEMLAGLAEGLAPANQFARRLAESGVTVLIPTLIDRGDEFSIAADGLRPTNQPHREFIYRQAFEMGRHIIGYEVQKVLALVDWIKQQPNAPAKSPAKIGVFGYGEGGLIALVAAALDPRIDATGVSGYFSSRQRVWEEPIYRNVWGLLDEFGDAELASLVTPRPLVVEACRWPEVSGPPPVRAGRFGAAPGVLKTPSATDVAQEVKRHAALVAGLSSPGRCELIMENDGKGRPGSSAALQAFLEHLLGDDKLAPLGETPRVEGTLPDAKARLMRQFDQLTEHTQALMRESEYTRAKFWEKADRASRSVEKWQDTTRSYRDYFYDEVIGRFERPLLPANVRTRKVYDEPKFVGYEVVMDVFPGVINYGILLLPKDLKPGERRPVVVCQHGLEGRPQDVVEANPAGERYYQHFAARLADQGYITYAPQNLYIFKDRFRTLQRKSNLLRKSLYSTIVPQHQQATDWLASLPMVDAKRIAFYGLSYGGKTAMRVPALVDRYCLSICSGDFNEWIWKCTSTRARLSYIGTGEYEIFEFDLGNTFNYFEMTGLIAPRPFMVERGHRDGVGFDEWVSYEYAKVRLLYADLKIPERTTIEYFDGPHMIHGVGTFEFLAKHLDWKR